jgi:hypothetical protein
MPKKANAKKFMAIGFAEVLFIDFKREGTKALFDYFNTVCKKT